MVAALYILVVLLLVFANGFFVASEFALVGVRRSRIETLADSGNSRACRLLNLLDHLNAYILPRNWGSPWPRWPWDGLANRCLLTCSKRPSKIVCLR
jgi:Cyclin M transmembrane N-terminal domain